MKFLKEFRHAYEYARSGDWEAAIKEFCSVVHMAVWWNYRCVQALEIHYPARKNCPARVVEIHTDDDEDLLDCIRYYLLGPGERVRLYVRYVSGKRRRILNRRF